MRVSWCPSQAIQGFLPGSIQREAGVDMEKPEPVAAAMQRFKGLVDKLETLV
jgi:oligoendopeptidase F